MFPKNITIDTYEALRVYSILEKVQQFLHQPSNYNKDPDVIKWLTDDHNKNYDEIAMAYYQIVWNWFPQDMKDNILEAKGKATI